MQRFTSTRYQRLQPEAPETSSSATTGPDLTKDSESENYGYDTFQEYSPEFVDPDKDDNVTATLLDTGRSLALGVPGAERRF